MRKLSPKEKFYCFDAPCLPPDAILRKGLRIVRKIDAVLLMGGCIALLIALAPTANRLAKGRDGRLATLTQTYIAVADRDGVHVPRLVTPDGDVMAPERLLGHWSPIFLGFTDCPLVCPKTLAILSAVARDPKSRVSSGGNP
jgi:cytochrome oxidase Cu insertion factor (SCO1/SenC/PrrC family)